MIPTPASAEKVPSYESLTAGDAAKSLWQSRKWAPGVLAQMKDTVSVPEQRKPIPLHVRLLQVCCCCHISSTLDMLLTCMSCTQAWVISCLPLT